MHQNSNKNNDEKANGFTGIRPIDIDRVVITRWSNDVTISWKLRPRSIKPQKGRSKVDGLSEGSLKRLQFVASNTLVNFSHMVTLTYPAEFPTNGREVKKHLNTFLQRLRRRNISYLWFLEWQRRGAPHFHVLISHLGDLSTKSISEAWYKIVGSGDEKHLRAGTNLKRMTKSDGGKRYAVKYASKRYQKWVPEGFTNVGRLWGHSSDVAPLSYGQEVVWDIRDLLNLFPPDSWVCQQILAWIEGEIEFPPALIFGSQNDLGALDDLMGMVKRFEAQGAN